MKRDTITIFVSGAKSLKEHRTRLKVLSNDINGELQRRGYTITLNMFSYMNLGDNQAEYDNFIKKKSDIVLFIIEDRIGEKTREEFLLASETRKKRGNPKIYVFLKEQKERTPELEEIEDLINGNQSSYYIEYSSMDDLVANVRNRLIKDIYERLYENNALPEKKLRRYKFWAIASTLMVCLLVGIGIKQHFTDDQKVVLLFVGGGSAMNCIKDKCESVGDLYNYEHSICMGVSSSVAWSLISGEILHHHAVKNDRVQIPFYPICLSAKEAKESDFLKLCDREQFVSKGSVLSVYIGDDQLVVYIKKSLNNDLVNGKDSIHVDDLSRLISESLEENHIIYTTQEGSGTLLSYRDILTPRGVEITTEAMGNNLQWFSSQTPSNNIRRDEQPYLILGSEYYTATEVYEEGDCRGLIVVDENGKTIRKPVYLYFAGYHHGLEGRYFWIPDEMVELLTKINPRYGDVIKDNQLPRRNEMVIVSLDEELEKM
ncbi:MAG: hypothetical protein K5683_02595 [Prevotella sp.]|nr:hypothetical protein [Prevotella sp.]